MASTFLASIDFRRLVAGFSENAFSETFGVNAINYDGFRSGTNNQKFINMWNSGIPAIYIGSNFSAFDGIARNGTYILRARAAISVSYSFPAPGPPLTSSEPITLSEIQNGFNASSLDDARTKAGFSSPINMLSFLGAATPGVITTESQTITSPSFVDTGTDWSFPGSVANFATTGSGSTPVNAIGFLFGTSVVSPIPSDATINSITVTVGTARTPADLEPAISAAMWFVDIFDDQSIPGPGNPLF